MSGEWSDPFDHPPRSIFRGGRYARGRDIPDEQRRNRDPEFTPASPVDALVLLCYESISRREAKEIERAATQAFYRHDFEAEQARQSAGYGGLPGPDHGARVGD